jgi:dipeptidyl aminopeptidase/acylaminoacyl peptidase
MRLFLVFLTLLLILTACAAPAQPIVAPADVIAPESDAPVLDGSFKTSLLVTEWRGGSEATVLFPLNPATGTALPSYTPISLGYSHFPAFSPDRDTLAVVSYPDERASDGSLLLIDLSAWTVRTFDLKLGGWVHSMAFSPDGKRLAIAHGEARFKLTMVDVAEGAITAQSQVDSFVSRLKFTESGEALMLYRPTIDPANILTAGPPQVLLLNAENLKPRWSAELANVHDGILPKDETVTEATLYQPGQAFYISPGLVFAPDRDTLYVVHADSEQLTTVDFMGQTVKTVDIQPRLTWFERLLSLTAGVAHAKIGDGISRQAMISPDGRFLYVVGVNSSTSVDERGNWQMEQTPLGLEILQTSDGNRLEHIDTDTTDVSMSPDGRFLYLRNWGSNEDNIPWTEILDIASGQIVTRKNGISGMPALLMNGMYLLVSTYSTGETSHHMSILKPDGSNVLAEWTAPTYIWWLTAP